MLKFNISIYLKKIVYIVLQGYRKKNVRSRFAKNIKFNLPRTIVENWKDNTFEEAILCGGVVPTYRWSFLDGVRQYRSKFNIKLSSHTYAGEDALRVYI